MAPKRFVDRTLLVFAAVSFLVLIVVGIVVHEQKQPPPLSEEEQAIWEREIATKIRRLYEEKREKIEESAPELFAFWNGGDEMPEGIRCEDGEYLEPHFLIEENFQSGEYKLRYVHLCDVYPECEGDIYPRYEWKYEEQEWNCPQSLKAFLDDLWGEYEVDSITVTPRRISFGIASDELRYYPDGFSLGGQEIRLDETWSHFWFPYSI